LFSLILFRLVFFWLIWCGLVLCGADTLVRLLLILLVRRSGLILRPGGRTAQQGQQHNREKQPKNPCRAPFDFIH